MAARREKKSMIYLGVLPSLGKYTDEKNLDIILIQALVHFGLVFSPSTDVERERERGRKSIADSRDSSSWTGIIRWQRLGNVCHIDVEHLGLGDNDERMRRRSLMNDHRLWISPYSRSIADSHMEEPFLSPRPFPSIAQTECLNCAFSSPVKLLPAG